MSIVMNEYEWAERMIENRDLGSKPSETLTRVAKYYIASGYSKQDARKKLDEFLIQCDPAVSMPNWEDTLDKAVKKAVKNTLIQMDSVDISIEEMKAIEKLGGKQLRRLAFTLLCIAKYWYDVSEEHNYWVNTPDREIMTMANINTSIKRQSKMFSDLRDAGLIRFSKKIDNLSVQVLFAEPGDTAIRVRDFRNLGYQYMKYYGGAYFECENCGITEKAKNPSKGRRQKYCPNCALEIKLRQSIDAVMRHRQALRNPV